MLLTLILNTIAFYFTTTFIPGIRINGSWLTSLSMVAVISVLNWGLRPFLILIAAPIIFMSFGLFLLVINGIVFFTASLLIRNVEIDDLPTAILTWGMYSLISFTINYPFGTL